MVSVFELVSQQAWSPICCTVGLSLVLRVHFPATAIHAAVQPKIPYLLICSKYGFNLNPLESTAEHCKKIDGSQYQ